VQIPDVPPELLRALRQAAAGQRIALVGGVVRDLLLHRQHQDPWRGLPDLDLVVEGPAMDWVSRLHPCLERMVGTEVPWRANVHGAYGTVALELQLPRALGGTWLLDVAMARREVYVVPGGQPQVSPGSLEDDLARRDFSVNAMALVVPFEGDPTLLDPHGGQADLAHRRLRLLHAQSVRDDPTRLVRAARYAARLGFELAADSRQQVHATLSSWPWPWRPGAALDLVPPALGTRLRMEFQLLLEREDWRSALAALQGWGGLVLLDAQLQAQTRWRQHLAWGERWQLPLLPLLVGGARDPVALARRLQLPHGQVRLLQRALQLGDCLQHSALPAAPSEWCALLEGPGFGAQVVAVALAIGLGPRRPLLRWYHRWRHVSAPLDGAALLAQGWPAGPGLGDELRRLRAQRLDRSKAP